jgi:glucose/arabinose dehydrogenase
MLHTSSKSILFFLITISLCAASCSGGKKFKPEENTPQDLDSLSAAYHLDKIKLPQGFSIKVYAEVPNARSMALSPSGVLYVGNRAEDKVYAVLDENKDGHADKVYTIAKGLESPNGVAFKDGSLYVATISTVLRFDNIEASLATPPKPVVVYDKFPTDKHHGWKFIAFGPDGKLYVPVGDPQNISSPDKEIYSTITRMNSDGSGLEIYARGIRNTVGFDWQPQNKKMWFTDNGRDELGEDIPGDELNYAPVAGMHFGHPFCDQGNIVDPQFGKGKRCEDYVAPAKVLDPHVAALGMRFYTGKMFDSSYSNKIFIAEHGSWNRSKAIGYRVMTVQTDSSGKASDYKVFAEGWLQPDGKVLGRPVDVLVMPDGALLVSDDHAGVIYRITYTATMKN